MKLVALVTLFAFFASTVLQTPLAEAKYKVDVASEAMSRAKHQLDKLIRGAATFDSFLIRIGPSLNPSQLDFLRKKGIASKATQIRITQRQPSTYLIEVKNYLLQLEVKSITNGILELTVNNKKLMYNPANDLDVFWNDLQATSPNQSARHFRFTFLPQAQAVEPITVAVVIAVLAVAGGITFFVHNKVTCEFYGIYLSNCTSTAAALPMFFEAARFDMVNPRVPLVCDERRKSLQDCVKREVRSRALEVPDDLRDYFGLTPKPETTKAAGKSDGSK